MNPVTLRQRAYQRLRDKILSGDIGPGVALSENQMATEFGMSRTPIREALRQMEMEGCIDYAPRFGAVVRVPDARDIEEMYAVREALEAMASEKAAAVISPDAIARLDRIMDSMRAAVRDFVDSGGTVLRGEPLRRFLEYDLEFHRVIIAAAGNRHLSKIVEETRFLVRIFLSAVWRYDRARLEEAIAFHDRLVAALRAGDARAARLATEEALRVSRDNALRVFGRDGGGIREEAGGGGDE